MIADWYSGAIIWKFEDGVLKFLVFWSWSIGGRYTDQPPQLKFPGGKSRNHLEDITPVHTLRREIPEELSEEGKIPIFIRSDANPIRVHVSPSDVEVARYPDLSYHQKNFFLVHESQLVGEIRSGYIIDGSSEMGPPMWLPARGIPLYGQHAKAARKAVKLLMNRPLFLALTA